MKELSFRGKIMLGFGAIIGLLGMVIVFCVVEIHLTQKNMVDIATNVQPYEILADQLSFDVVQVQQFLTDVAATHDREGYEEAEKHARSFREGIENFKAHFSLRPEKIQQLEALAASFEKFYAHGKQMSEIYVTQGIEAGNAEMESFDMDARDITEKMNGFRQDVLADAQHRVSLSVDSGRRAIILGIAVAVLGLVAGLGIAWKLSQGLLDEIGIDPRYARGIAKEIAKGDLSRDIFLNEGDKSSLLFAMRAMQMQLREMIHDVTRNAYKIVESAHHLSQSAQIVLSSSQRQSDAASSVAAAVEEMTASIEQISANAEHSEKMAKQAGNASDQGNVVVAGAVEEMNRIAASVGESTQIIRELGVRSQKISEIINVIKEIADQTNLLALNAAIEAARAGEQGRGFAVVADEVRKLAERTSRSTQEISDMVGEILNSTANAVSSMEQGMQRVTEGVEKARLAGASMSQIKEGMEQVVASVADITHALKEQTAAVNQVAQEVELIASMVQDNTEAVDDLAQTSAQLNQLSDVLKESVGHFKVS